MNITRLNSSAIDISVRYALLMSRNYAVFTSPSITFIFIFINERARYDGTRAKYASELAGPSYWGVVSKKKATLTKVMIKVFT